MEYKKIDFDDYSFFYVYNFDNSKIFLEEILKNEYKIFNYDIIKNKNGKPYLKDNNVFFNISHKKDIIGIAVSKKAIGLDIEYIDSLKPINDSVLKHFFSNSERLHIKSNKDLLEIWTKKEAYIKLIGGKVVDTKKVDTFNLNVKFNNFKINDYIITICYM